MAWTTPTSRTTGELITASIWNVDLVADLVYLKAQVDAPGAGILSLMMGGSRETGEVGVAMRAGAGADIWVWGSRSVTWPATLSGITAKFDAMLASENVAATATLGIVNLTDAPNTFVTSVTSTSTTGQLKTSSSFTPIVGKDYAFKLHSAHATFQAWAWAITLYPAG